jgi:formiminotetrahydrofolate cyclodeaminase
MRLNDFLAALADRTPTPGGGAVAGVTLALAAALGEMVIAYTLGKPRYAEHDAAQRSQRGRLGLLRGEFLRLADDDAAAYAGLSAIQRLAPDDPARESLPDRFVAAAEPPLQMAELGVELRQLLETLVGTTSRPLLSDLEIARDLARAGHRAALHNVQANLASIPAGGARATIVLRLGSLSALATSTTSDRDPARAEPSA